MAHDHLRTTPPPRESVADGDVSSTTGGGSITGTASVDAVGTNASTGTMARPRHRRRQHDVRHIGRRRLRIGQRHIDANPTAPSIRPKDGVTIPRQW
jgi:hypothetical protein